MICAAAMCQCVASVERHSDRLYVAMVAQDLVVSKQPEAFHTHDIPSVHGSGAFGLALQSNTYGLVDPGRETLNRYRHLSW